MSQVMFLARGLERAQPGLERTRSQLPQSQRQSAHRTRRARPSRSRTSRKARAKPDPTKTLQSRRNPEFPHGPHEFCCAGECEGQVVAGKTHFPTHISRTVVPGSRDKLRSPMLKLETRRSRTRKTVAAFIGYVRSEE